MYEAMMHKEVDGSLKKWREKEKKALELLRIVGELRFDKAIELILFRRDIYDARPSEVINHHLYAENYVDSPISIEMSLSIAEIIAKLDLQPARIDIGSKRTTKNGCRDGRCHHASTVAKYAIHDALYFFTVRILMGKQA